MTSEPTAQASRARRVFFVIGEDSGDRLGASLVAALQQAHGADIAFEGLAGDAMQGLGMSSLFDIEDIAVMGIGPVIARLPTILSRIGRTVDAIIASQPDLVILIDSPDFTHRVARAVRRRAPNIPIIGWVSPSVWAWRPGRAKAMRAYIDELLVLLPFEVEAHRTLGGPPATYVGHPLVDEATGLRPADEFERPPLVPTQPATILLLPGSRTGEISRLMPVLHETLARLLVLMEQSGQPAPRLVLPAVTRHEPRIAQMVAQWPFQVAVVNGQEAKRAAFRQAHAAIAASGTVTLELGLAGVPTVVVYKLDGLARLVRFLVKTWTTVLPNLVLGRPVVREYIDEYIRIELLARALMALATDTPERRAQVEAFKELDQVMRGPDEASPAQRARGVVERLVFPARQP
jgi:lipid-A-disaccharide synthase